MHTYVTPLAGVWIEILWEYARENGRLVTPLAGVWIEICLLYTSDAADD